MAVFIMDTQLNMVTYLLTINGIIHNVYPTFKSSLKQSNEDTIIQKRSVLIYLFYLTFMTHSRTTQKASADDMT